MPPSIDELTSRWRANPNAEATIMLCDALRGSPLPSLVEEVGQVVDVRDGDSPLDLAALLKAQRDRGDRAEQAVAADRQRKQAGVHGPAAHLESARGIDDGEGVDVGHEGAKAEAATVDVGRQRAAERQVVGARLLLDDAPRVLLVGEGPEQVVDQLHPVDARFNGDEAAFAIDIDDAVEGGHVHERAGGAELLPAHGVTAATEAERLTRTTRRRHQLLQLAAGARPEHARNAGGIQLRVDVVDQTVMTRPTGDARTPGACFGSEDGVHTPRR